MYLDCDVMPENSTRCTHMMGKVGIHDDDEVSGGVLHAVDVGSACETRQDTVTD